MVTSEVITRVNWKSSGKLINVNHEIGCDCYLRCNKEGRTTGGFSIQQLFEPNLLRIDCFIRDVTENNPKGDLSRSDFIF